MKGNGKTTIDMDLELKFSPMRISTTAGTKEAISKEQESIGGKMVIPSQVPSKVVSKWELAFGNMAVRAMKAISKMMHFMVRGFTRLRMRQSMMVCGRLVRNTVPPSRNMLMGTSSWVTSIKVNKLGKAIINISLKMST